MPEVDEKVRVRLAVPAKEHNELRILAARSGLSMSQYAEAILIEAIRKLRVVKQEKP